MKTNNWVYVLGFLLLIGSFFLGRWSIPKPENKEQVTVVIPPQSGSSPVITNPKPLPPVYKDSIQYRDSIITVENPFNKELADRYISLESDTAKLRAYLASISTKEYEIPFEDEKIKIDNKIKTQGEVLSFQQNYKIKEQRVKVDVSVPKSIFAMYGGVEAGSNTSLDRLVVKGEIGLQFKGNTIYTIGMDNEKNFYAGVNIKIFDIKK